MQETRAFLTEPIARAAVVQAAMDLGFTQFESKAGHLPLDEFRTNGPWPEGQWLYRIVRSETGTVGILDWDKAERVAAGLGPPDGAVLGFFPLCKGLGG